MLVPIHEIYAAQFNSEVFVASHNPKIVIIGAGPAGLAAALFAAQRGLSVQVIEREESVGGLAGSHLVDGVRVDAGSHRLHPATPSHLLELLRNELGEDLQQRLRKGRLRVAGQWVAFPLNAVDIARTMPPAWLLKVAWESLVITAQTLAGRDQPAATSFEESLRRSLGHTTYETLYGPYAPKLWGLKGTEIDAEQARVRVTANSPTKLLARIGRSTLAALSLATAGSNSTARGTTFYYPRKGFGQIADALRDAAISAGVEISTGATVAHIQPGTTVTVTTTDGQEFSTSRVLSTIPATALVRLLPDVPKAIVDHTKALDTRAMLFVYLTHQRPDVRQASDVGQTPDAQGPVRWTPFDAHYFPGGDTPVTRVSEPLNYRDSADDPLDRTVLCAEIPCSTSDPLWTAADQELAQIVAKTLETNDLPLPEVTNVAVKRVPSAYPVYKIGYRPHVDALEQWIEKTPGVTTFGRAGLFAHDNTHHGLVMAQRVVACIRNDGSFDGKTWAADRQSFRAHVVED